MESVDWAVNTDWKEINMLEGVGGLEMHVQKYSFCHTDV